MNHIIHPTAIIRPNVEIEDNVVIGAYAVIGGMPEHAGYYSGLTTKGVRIHKGVRIFEFVTIHAGTENQTIIEEGAAIFNHSHVAHDCYVGKNAVIGGQVSLAGHTWVMERAVIGGKSCTHQRCVIGAYSFLSPMSYLKAHIPPGELWIGNPARPSGLNQVGLNRAPMTHEMCLERFEETFHALTRNSKL